MDFTLCQKNEIGELRFPAGLTKIKRNELDLQFGGFKETFGYERRAIEGNIYHGNLLLLAKEEKPTKKMIRSALAVLAKKEIIERN